jgi:putative transposase
MKTYTLKLYLHDKNEFLKDKINIAGIIWNHIVRLQKRHRSLFYRKDVKEVPECWVPVLEKIKENRAAKKYPGKSFSNYRVYNKLQRIRQKNRSPFGHQLNELHAASIQVIVERMERAFKLFFTKLKRGERNIESVKTQDPWFYPSFAFKTGGYKLDWGSRKITIMGQTFKFFEQDYQPKGKIKMLTVKRDLFGHIYLYLVSDEVDEPQPKEIRPIVGMDVWVNPILTLSDGTIRETPLFFREKLPELRKLDKRLSRKMNIKKANDAEAGGKTPLSHKYKNLRFQKIHLFRDIVRKRKQHHIKLARELAKTYGTIAVPDVPLHRLAYKFGMRVMDLRYADFLTWLEAQCLKTGTVFLKVKSRYQMLTTCHICGHVLVFAEGKSPKPVWTCPNCGTEHNREYNVAKNIEAEAIKMLEEKQKKDSLEKEKSLPAEAGKTSDLIGNEKSA